MQTATANPASLTVAELIERDRQIGNRLDAIDQLDDRARQLLRDRRAIRDELNRRHAAASN
jgi:hypothetical protein